MMLRNDVYGAMWRDYINDDRIWKMAKLAWKNPTTAPAQANDPIKAAIDELATVRARMKEDRIREDALKKILGDLTEGLHPGNKVALEVKYGTHTSLDTKSLKAAYPAVYDEFERSTPSTKLTIKPLIS